MNEKYHLQMGNADTELYFQRIWLVDGSDNAKLFEAQADLGPLTFSKIKAGAPTSKFAELNLRPGEYYPRMARPTMGNNEDAPGINLDSSLEARERRVNGTGQLHALIEKFEAICRVVQPVQSNMQSFGHEIRNTLILACTEVETQWKGILQANSYVATPSKVAMTTKDYVKLLSAMKLSDYKIALNYYPWLGEFSPFDGWCVGTPTRSLTWYDAYNAVKHDRDSNFQRATLKEALYSLAGCFVMFCAQYGIDFAEIDEGAERAFFRLVKMPKWDPAEIYVKSKTTSPIHYTF